MDAEDQSSATPPPEEENMQAEEADEVALLREQLEEALREKDQFRTMAQRSQADLMNYRRRAAEDMEELRRTANSRSLLNLLSIVDDLERAFSLIPDDAVAPGWLEGLHLVLRNITGILDLEGVSKIDAVGRSFEPRECEAVQYQETEEAEEGQVIQVLRDGYKHHDKVLRAAQVIVAKKPEPEHGSETTEKETQ
jgi:molecular chaperone GrpE